jgi:hypothetical protein
MKSCSCGSMAINPHCHGREPGVDLDLCDVCYWRARCGALSKERADMVKAFRDCRKELLLRGIGSWEFAWMCKILPMTLSKWTATAPTTEPDFVD